MTLLPVIERELRTVARQPLTYHLRALVVLALLVVLAVFGLEGKTGPGVGGELFTYLHRTLFFGIWALVPLSAADAISRERREGTLPLLFLTPLKPINIVYAKGMAHGLRAFALWLAVLPVLAVSLVAGGVSWPDMLISALLNFSSVCLALGAGLLASTRTRVWTRALALALFFAAGFLLTFFAVIGLLVAATNWKAGFNIDPGDWARFPEVGSAVAVNFEGCWSDWMVSRSSARGTVFGALGGLTLLTLLSLVLLLRTAAFIVKQTWQEQPLSARVAWLKDRLVQPVLFQKVLKRWLRWELQRNPIGWLERRSWNGRLVVWSWFAIVVCLYSSLFANFPLYQHTFHALQTILASLLAASIALSSAGSFRRERETGVLELLLVAPLREWQIISGRVRGLWGQFLPAVILLCAVWMYCAGFLSSENELPSILMYLVTFATLPVVGLYFSLAKSNFFAALLWTLLVQFVLPTALIRVVFYFLFYSSPYSGAVPPPLVELGATALAQVSLALFLGHRLHTNLARRRFALGSSGV